MLGIAVQHRPDCSALHRGTEERTGHAKVQCGGLMGEGTHLSSSCGCCCSGNSSGALVRKALLKPPATTPLTTGALPPRACTQPTHPHIRLHFLPYYSLTLLTFKDSLASVYLMFVQGSGSQCREAEGSLQGCAEEGPSISGSVGHETIKGRWGHVAAHGHTCRKGRRSCVGMVTSLRGCSAFTSAPTSALTSPSSSLALPSWPPANFR